MSTRTAISHPPPQARAALRVGRGRGHQCGGRPNEAICEDTLGETWKCGFRAGERAVLERLYRDHFHTVARAVGRSLAGADRETVIHEVFLRILSSSELRGTYRGGSLAAWLFRLARNHAIDRVRRRTRERPQGLLPCALGRPDTCTRWEDELEASQLIGRFCRDVLPPQWRPAFEARFLRQLGQHEAAHELGIYRTTFAYRERRIRDLLRRFLEAARDGRATSMPLATVREKPTPFGE